jgi:hypothetical protein
LAVGAVLLLGACGSAPVIKSFAADKASVNRGESVQLTWAVEDAESLTLNGNTVTGSAATLTPTETTTYTLTATNGHGAASSAPVSVTVTVSNEVTGQWTVLGADRYQDGKLVIDVPSLGPDEHLAIIAMNLDGEDSDPSVPVSNATISVSGTNPVASARPPPAAPVTQALLAAGNGPDGSDGSGGLLRRAQALRGHEQLRAQEVRVLQDAAKRQQAGLKLGPSRSTAPLRTALVAPTNTDFCVQQGIAAGAPHVRKTATLKKETAHALFYLDDDDALDYAPYETGGVDDIWNKLGDLWDGTIYPADTQTFGGESDVDGNGKLIVFFSSELGGPSSGGVVLGYYWAGDVVYPLDLSTDCADPDGQGSNGADMFYMNSLANLRAAGYQDADVIDGSYPDTLGHEFQHLINFNQKHIVTGNYTTSEATWINEGLAVTAEDVIGFGWNTASGRDSGNAFLTDQPYTADAPYLRYYNASLTVWEGDPIGNYQGAHSFFRYFADRMGEGILKDLVQTSQVGIPNLTDVLGESFDQAYAEWATALMFSNETSSPDSRFDFTGANWDPLHQKLTAANTCSTSFPYPGRPGYVQYETFDVSGQAEATLRQDGWNAFVTNAGLGQPVSITVTPTQSGVQPAVTVIRFTGSLPDGRQSECLF